MSEVLQILGLCTTILFFIWWILALKRDQAVVRKEISELKKLAREKTEKEVANRAAAAEAKNAETAGTSKLWMIGNRK